MPEDTSEHEILYAIGALRNLEKEFRLEAQKIPGTFLILTGKFSEDVETSSIILALKKEKVPTQLVDQEPDVPVFGVISADPDRGVIKVKVDTTFDKVKSGVGYQKFEYNGEIFYIPYDESGAIRHPADPQDPYFTSQIKDVRKNNKRRARLSLPEDKSYRNLENSLSKNFKLDQLEPDTSFDLKKFMAKQFGKDEAEIEYFRIEMLDGAMTFDSAQQFNNLVDKLYPDASINELGRGGMNLVYKVCMPSSKCVATKFAMASIDPDAELDINSSITQFIHNIGLAFIAKKYFESAKWVKEDGHTPKPFTVNGVVKKPAQWKGGFASVLTPDPKKLAYGAWEVPLLDWNVSDDFLKDFYAILGKDAENVKQFKKMVNSRNSKLILDKHKSWTPEARRELTEVRIESERLIDLLSKKEELNFEVSSIADIIRSCNKLKNYTSAIQRLCFNYREEFNIPDDFLDRVHALEYMYRYSSKKINNWQLGNFGHTMIRANKSDSPGHAHIVGFDYNRGDNVAWNPKTGEFVIFDE